MIGRRGLRKSRVKNEKWKKENGRRKRIEWTDIFLQCWYREEEEEEEEVTTEGS